MLTTIRPVWLASALAAAMVIGGAVIAFRLVAAPSPPPPARPVAPSAPPAPVATAARSTLTALQSGMASIYSDALHGRKTASGELYDKTRLTAAHLTLPFGTRVRVTSQRTRQSVEVRINDRGPRHEGWIVDLSREAALRLGLEGNVVTRVTVEVIGPAAAGSR